MAENTSSWHSAGDANTLNEFEKLKIWGKTTPGNSKRRKSEVMDIRKGLLNNDTINLIRFFMALSSRKVTIKGKRMIDTYTDSYVKKRDADYQETFSDEPYVIPFIAKGSDKAVIVVPGGGYCFKSMEGEGVKIAQALQRNGITAFVLWYRTNPYYLPYPLMDMQRAVRYVRFHAKEYGYDEDKIGAIGFSAGGAQVALFLNVMRVGLIEIPKYPKDEIDAVDDALNFAAPIYPALAYGYNSNMMYASFPAEVVRDESKRKDIVDKYDAIKHMNCDGVPHFISYGTKDNTVSIEDIQQYILRLKERKTPCQVLPVEGAGHGYGEASGTKYSFWLDEFVNWVKNIE